MMLITAIIIGSIAVITTGIAVITVSGISFAKKVMDDDENLDEVDIETRNDKIPLLNNKFGTLKVCPFCTSNNKQYKLIPTGLICKNYMDSGNVSGMIGHKWFDEGKELKIAGPSSPTTIMTKYGPRIYQACTYCGAEWTVLPDALIGTISNE